MSFFAKLIKKNYWLIIILFLGVILRLYQLNELPGEIWGDVNEHYLYAQEILKGDFYFHFDFGGDGPLISYFIALVSMVFGLSFYTIKLTTVIVDLLTVFLTYLTARELFKDQKTALISAFLSAVSFWSLSFSRQGKPYILVPLFILLAIYFSLKKNRHFVAGFFIGLGMYTQAAFWGMFLFLLTSFRTLVAGLLVSTPFLISIYSSPASFFAQNSYLGEKMGLTFSFSDKILLLGGNVLESLMAFNIRGDIVFRNNIVDHPHLDILSGLFLVVGFIWSVYSALKLKNPKLIKFLLLPFFIVQIPSILDIANPENVPNMGRTIGVTPFVYMLIALGIVKVVESIGRGFKYLAYTAVLLIILGLNLNNYFFVYPKGLPNENVSFSKVIAEKIKSTPRSTAVVVVGCCWGEWGQPEPKSIAISSGEDRTVDFLYLRDFEPVFSCESLQERAGNKKNVILFIRPDNEADLAEVSRCFKSAKTVLIKKEKWNIVRIIEGSL